MQGERDAKAERAGQANSVASIPGQRLDDGEEQEGAYQWRKEVSESRGGATGLEYIDRVLKEIFVPSMRHDLGGIIVSHQFFQLLGSNHAKSGCRRGLPGDQGLYLGQGIAEETD